MRRAMGAFRYRERSEKCRLRPRAKRACWSRAILPPTNIGPAERAKRRTVGILLLAIATGGAAWMQWAESPALLRLLLFAPFGIGFLGILQARAGT